MRNSLVLATVAALALCGTAAAQQSKEPAHHLKRDVGVVNCLPLKGKPFICVWNETDDAVMNIDCDGSFWGTNGVPLPVGGIAPHSMTVVEFRKVCKTALTFTFLGGEQVKTGHVNTDEMVALDVPKQHQ